LLAGQIDLSENVSRGSAILTGIGTTRTLSPVTVSGNGIITVSIDSMYRVETGTKIIRIIPDSPTGLTTVVTASTVTLKWEPVYLATGYRVESSKSASGTFTPIITTSSTSFINIRLSPNTSYYYRVTAINSAGESIVSSQVSATTLGPNTQLAIPVSSDTIVIEWTQDAGRDRDFALRFLTTTLEPLGLIIGGSPSFSYRYVIYRNDKFVEEIEIPTRLALTPVPPFFTLTQDSSLADHFYVDTGRMPNMTYKYRVTVKASFDLGILKIINKVEETDIMTASATTLSEY